MKLLDRYNRISLIATMLVIVVAGIVYYFTISFILTHQVDKDLMVEENEIFEYVKLNHKLPQVFRSEDLKITFEPVWQETVQRRFIDTQYRDIKDNDEEAGRGLISQVTVAGVNYRVTIIESKVETEDLIRMIFFITLGIILMLLVVLTIINRFVIRKLWQPFHQMLSQIKLFNVADQSSINKLDTRIEEFKEMNEEVSAMSLRVRSDYQELKNFVENAAHELMTPLAVINSKLDTLAQDNELTNRQGTLIGEVYNSVSKMKMLNRSMLLLSKIENRLIQEQEIVDLKQKVADAATDFQELLAAKQLQMHTHLAEASITINKDLLDVLLNNLIGNAIRHNYTGGEIDIELKPHSLAIANTGSAEVLESALIFQRFHRSPGSDGTGLGLTIAREICESSGYRLAYAYLNSRHVFTINF